MSDGTGDKLINSPEYRQYPIRWAMISIFASLSITNAILWIAFAPIQSFACVYFGVSSTKINMLSMAFMVLYLPGSMLSTYCFGHLGMRKSLILGAAMNAVSGWIRYAAAHSDEGPTFGAGGYWLLLCGQLVSGMSQPFFTNAPAKIASEWFSVDSRNMATTLGSMANPVGIAIGQLLPSLLVSGAHDGMALALLVQALIATGTLVLVTLFFQSKPPTPPSRSQESRHELKGGVDPTTQMFRDVSSLLSDINFVLLMIGFGIGLAMFNSLSTLIEQFIAPCGYSSSDAGLFGALIIGAGLVGAGIGGALMDATHAYNWILRGGAATVTGAIVFLIASLREHNSAMLTASFAVLGFFVTPLLPVSFECTYPVSEESSSGFLMLSGNIPSIALILLVDHFIKAEPKACYTFTKPNITLLACMGIMLVAVTLYRGQYKRMQAEKQNQKQHLLIDEDAPSSSAGAAAAAAGSPHTPIGGAHRYAAVSPAGHV